MSKAPAQFARIESYALKERKGGSKTTVSGVCKENSRFEDFSRHIDKPMPPDLLFGQDPFLLSLDIAKRAKELDTEAVQAGLPRHRKDKLVMCGGTYSFPIALPLEGEDASTFESWKSDCLEFLKSKYGEHLKSVVVHLDESHPHLHFLVCDMRSLRVDQGLDPAKTAQYQRRALKNQEAPSQIDAYKSWQDEFHQAVGVKYGHARDSGERKRPRIHGKSTKDVKKALEAIEEADAKLLDIASREKTLESATKRLSQHIQTVKTKGHELVEKEQELREREKALGNKEEQAKGFVEKLAHFWLSLKERFEELRGEGHTAEAMKVGHEFQGFRDRLRKYGVEKQVVDALNQIELQKGQSGGATPPLPPLPEGYGRGQKRLEVPLKPR